MLLRGVLAKGKGSIRSVRLLKRDTRGPSSKGKRSLVSLRNVCLTGQGLCAAGDGKANGTGSNLNGEVVVLDQLAVRGVDKALGCLDVNALAAAVDDVLLQLGIVQVASVGIDADQAEEGDVRHGAHHAHLKPAVVIERAGRTAEGAAHVLTVGDGAEQDLALGVKLLAVHGDAAGVLHGLKEADDDAGGIGVFAADQLFAADVGHGLRNGGVEAKVGGVDGVFVAHAHQVDPFLLGLNEGGDVKEIALAAVVFYKIVSGAAGINADGGVGKADGAVDDLIEGAVAAAGIEADALGVRGAVVADVIESVRHINAKKAYLEWKPSEDDYMLDIMETENRFITSISIKY